MTTIAVAASVPFTIAMFTPAQKIDTEAKLITAIKAIGTTLALPTTIKITPDDQTEEGVTLARAIMDRENKNGASDGVASISRIGSKAAVNFALSRDIQALDNLFFKPDTKAATTTDPGFKGYGDKAGLTTGLCDEAGLFFTILLPHLCGVATTDVEQMLLMPWSVPRAANIESRFALNTQYQVSGLAVEGLACPYDGDIKGKHRFYKVIKPTTP